MGKAFLRMGGRTGTGSSLPKPKKGGSTMYTLVDFITHVKGIEYILSLAAIAGFLLFWEA